MMISNKHERRRKKKTKSKKKELQEAEDLAEEERLTSLLFGGSGGKNGPSLDNTEDTTTTTTRTAEPPQPAAPQDEKQLGAIFEIDRVGQEDDEDADDVANEHTPKRASASTSGKNSKTPKAATTAAAAAVAQDAPVWQDEDDDNDDTAVRVNLLRSSRLRKLRTSKTEAGATSLRGSQLEQRLRKRFKSTTQISARTDWAHVSAAAADDDDDSPTGRRQRQDDAQLLDSSAEPLLLSTSGSSNRLPPNILNTMRCPDANQSDPNQAVVQAVHFHPGSNPDNPLLLTAGFDKTLRFFQVGQDKSEKVHGIHFPKLPIYSASFLGTSGKVVVSGRRRFFYIYDAVAGKLDYIPRVGGGREEKSLETCVASPDGRTLAFGGNDGYVILWDAHAKRWIGNLKLNGSVRAITFSVNGEEILASGSDGDVYRWNVQSRRCLERFANEDGTITSALAASSRNLAVGAESGVVNLYHHHHHHAERIGQNNSSSSHTPIKSIMNLHTSADMVRFNHDGQVLALSSRREKGMGSLKLVHVPTATVFANWPTSKTPLHYVWSTDFSPASRFLAVGNDQGKCLLYRLNHYQDD